MMKSLSNRRQTRNDWLRDTESVPSDLGSWPKKCKKPHRKPPNDSATLLIGVSDLEVNSCRYAVEISSLLN